MIDAGHPVLTHRNGDVCIWLDGEWFVPLDVGGEGYTCGNPEHENGIPHGRSRWEYGIERRIAFHNFEQYITWGAWVGPDGYREDYTAENVHSAASGNPMFRRKRTTFPDTLGEPEALKRERQ